MLQHTLTSYMEWGPDWILFRDPEKNVYYRVSSDEFLYPKEMWGERVSPELELVIRRIGTRQKTSSPPPLKISLRLELLRRQAELYLPARPPEGPPLPRRFNIRWPT